MDRACLLLALLRCRRHRRTLLPDHRRHNLLQDRRQHQKFHSGLESQHFRQLYRQTENMYRNRIFHNRNLHLLR